MTAFLQIPPVATFWVTVGLSLLIGVLLGFWMCWLGRGRYWSRRADQKTNGLIMEKTLEIKTLTKENEKMGDQIEYLKADIKAANNVFRKGVEITNHQIIVYEEK